MGQRAWMIQKKNKYNVWEDVDGTVRYDADEIAELFIDLYGMGESYRILPIIETMSIED